ncbi:MAG: HTH domain-containing protein [Candidatus Aenigmatarchaeota archaeon]
MESKKQMIINYLKSKNEKVSLSQIAKDLKLSYATCIKWIQFLELEGKIEKERLGNLVLVGMKNA